MKIESWVSLIATAAVFVSWRADAAVIAQWNFNSTVPDSSPSTGTLTPTVGLGSASTLGGVSSSFAAGAGSSDPAVNTDDSGWNIGAFASQGTENQQRGVQFTISTVGNQDIVITWDQRHTSSSSANARFQFTTDGVNWQDSTLFTASQASGTDVFYNQRSVDLSAFAAVNNNALFAFRIVSEFAPATSSYDASGTGDSYGTTGTWRFDMVTIQAVPEPTNIALGIFALGLLGVSGTRAWRAAQQKLKH